MLSFVERVARRIMLNVERGTVVFAATIIAL